MLHAAPPTWTLPSTLSILTQTGISTYKRRKILQLKRAYKVCAAIDWAEAERAGVYTGAPVDRADGFIHLSTGDQVAETLRRHFAGRTGLVLVALDIEKLGEAVRWEPSRGGALFPHVYGLLPAAAAISVMPVPDDADARSAFAAHLHAGAS
ncbi:MAG TPA: DUF952 domain-containing protein [Caulobacterales bacterium]|nr:DUF952 domain-containing protein [Caulobacterales bacterium]